MSKLVLLFLIVAAFHSSAQQARSSSWFKANEYCNYLGMRLAIISSQEDQAKLIEVLKSTDQYGTEEGNFHWVATGTRLQFTRWHPHQPDNGIGAEHCLELRYIPSEGWDWHWNDRGCSTSHYFACENVEGREIVLF
ncbi:galactose-specific C-type lectin [Culex quinquefasciatus]|uniref:Galactose-specific C-type lectin n=1 Tax=Culex quinquefasciatus TaxID=7176 RepID=B0W317_CULQU|nr:galactose-specific C-type lectin [Culex quinquefasciatus]|eukprot:XP_001843101.1 galactose-specific C-type lectin [Culex quinquefasciatus]